MSYLTKLSIFRDIQMKDDDLEIRLQSISKNGIAQALVYKTARVDHRILDEIVGSINWQKEYREIGGIVFCGLSIRDDLGNWVTKWDVGTQDSSSEKEKSIASDGIKRAGSAWGIGAELYTLRPIAIKLKDSEYYMQGDKAKQSWALNIRLWSTKINRKDDGTIDFIEILDDEGNVRNYKHSSTIGKNIPAASPKDSEPVGDKEPPTQPTKWLNKTDAESWNKVVNSLKNKEKTKGGEIITVDIIKRKYKLSKVVETELTEIQNKTNN